MKHIRAITVCVDYHDILALTLPHNQSQFESVTVVTHPEDSKTIAVAQENDADLFLTDVFYDRGAVFNRFAALEQGLDYIVRSGWICIIDADIAVPHDRHPWTPKAGKLYVPRRRVLPQIPSAVPEQRKWRQMKCPLGEFSGHCQIFSADDSCLPKGPWHPLHWTWAGGAQSDFERFWNSRDHARPPFEVLHIGPTKENWAGRVTPYADGTVDGQAERRRSIRQNLLNQRKVPLLDGSFVIQER